MFAYRGDTSLQALRLEIENLFGSGASVILTSSARSGLWNLFSCLPHKQVVVPAYTCGAVIEAASLAGKHVVYMDNSASNFNSDLREVSSHLNADSILVLTHQYGAPNDPRRATMLAKRVGAFVLEDCAAALGSRSNGQLVGTLGDAAVLSFDVSKLVHAPLKGGAIITRNGLLYADCRKFQSENTRNSPVLQQLFTLLQACMLVFIQRSVIYRIFHYLKFGLSSTFTDETVEISKEPTSLYTTRLANWQASIVLSQIRNLDSQIEIRRSLYARYAKELSGIDGLELPPFDYCQEWAPIRYSIRVKGAKLNFYRRLNRFGVDASFSFSHLVAPETYVNAHQCANEVLNLPFYSRLSDREFRKVVDVVRKIANAKQN